MVKKILSRFYVVLILLLMYAPILTLIIYSFTDADNIGAWNGFSFALYKQMFASDAIKEALFNTLLIALASSICSTILGTLGAIGIFYSKGRYRNMMTSLNQVPVMNAEIVIAISLTLLFVFFGIEFNFVTLLIGHMVITIPFVVLSVLPKLRQLDPNTYEAALDLGATPHRALWTVIVPEILPGIFSGFLLCITLSLDDYIITAFTRNDSFNTLSTYIYGVTAKHPLPPALRALTTLITIFMLIVLLIINYRSKKQAKLNSQKKGIKH